MIEGLDEARKYVELYKTAIDNDDTEGSIIYGLRAASILTVIHDTSRDEEEVKKVELLEKEMFPPSLIPHVDREKFIPYLLGEIW